MTGLRRTPLLGVVLLVLVASGLLAVVRGPSTSIRINLDGQWQTVTTRAGTVGEALAAAGIGLDPLDVVRPPLEAPLDAATPIVIQRAAAVGVLANDRAHLLRTQPAAPAEVLAGLGLSLGPADALWGDGALLSDPAVDRASMPRNLVLQRALPITIEDGHLRPREVRAAARTVGEALWQLGYRVYQGDRVSPALDAPLTPALTIRIERSRPVLIQADGQSLATRTRAETVGEALAEAGVPLVGEDYAIPDETQPLPETGVVSVVRVREEIITEQQLIPYETIYQALPEVEIDTVYQVQAGLPGVLRRLTRVRYENGVEVARTTDGEVLAQAARPQVIGYGTNIVIRTLDTPDGPIEYWRAYTMYATSYAAKFTGRDPNSPSYGRTASGKYVTKGIVAIDRSLIPFGTRMYVPGYGFAEAADTGGGVRGRFIDLGFDDWNYQSWSKVVTVYFLTPVPPASQIRWIIPSTVP